MIRSFGLVTTRDRSRASAARRRKAVRRRRACAQRGAGTVVDALPIPASPCAVPAERPEMLVHRERREQSPPLRDIRDPATSDLVGLAAEESLPMKRSSRWHFGGVMPIIALQSVVLPIPFRPTTATASRPMVNETPSSAWALPVEGAEPSRLDQRITGPRAPELARSRGIPVRGRDRARSRWPGSPSGVPSTMTRPSCIIVTRSATLSAMSMSCSIRTSVIEAVEGEQQVGQEGTRSPRERPDAGSSSISILGSAASAIAIATWRCSPCERSPTSSRELVVDRDPARPPRARARASASSRPGSSTGRSRPPSTPTIGEVDVVLDRQPDEEARLLVRACEPELARASRAGQLRDVLAVAARPSRSTPACRRRSR